jgi:hypothetical protein
VVWLSVFAAGVDLFTWLEAGDGPVDCDSGLAVRFEGAVVDLGEASVRVGVVVGFSEVADCVGLRTRFDVGDGFLSVVAFDLGVWLGLDD